MNKLLVYTFRTFPDICELKKQFDNVFVLGTLKKDINLLCQKIIQNKPSFILGVAKSTSKDSYFEPLTINQFNKDKKVINHLNQAYDLYVPNLQNTGFTLSKKPTTTFCNYAMYKIECFLRKENMRIDHSFVHLSQDKIKELHILL